MPSQRKKEYLKQKPLIVFFFLLSTHLTHHGSSAVGDWVMEHLRKNWDLNGKKLEVLIY